MNDSDESNKFGITTVISNQVYPFSSVMPFTLSLFSQNCVIYANFSSLPLVSNNVNIFVVALLSKLVPGFIFKIILYKQTKEKSNFKIRRNCLLYS